MNIEGTYQINIEQTVRKQVDGILDTAKRLIGHLGVGDLPDPPDKEEHIQRVMALFKQHESALRDISMEIQVDRIVAGGSGAEETYLIKDRRENGDGRILLTLESDELGPLQWDATFVADRFFMFESEDEMSQYVWERVSP